MSEFYSWVKSIIVFLVLTTVIGNLLGKSSYKKFVNLITGIILLLLVITPLLKVFKLECIFDYYFSTNSFVSESKDMSHKLLELEEKQLDTIFTSYKEKLKTQITNLLEKDKIYVSSIVITIDEDEKSNTYGQIKAMNIEAGFIRNDTSKEDSSIRKINIDKIDIGEDKKSDKSNNMKFLSPSEINAKKTLSDFYNMNPDNINISIRE